MMMVVMAMPGSGGGFGGSAADQESYGENSNGRSRADHLSRSLLCNHLH